MFQFQAADFKQLIILNILICLFFFFFQNALLDLLGGTENSIDLDIIKPASQTNSQPLSNSNNQDLLDLLGLDPLPSGNNDMVITPSSKSVMSNNLGLLMENNNSNLLDNVNSQNTNFLMDDLFTAMNTNDTVNGKLSYQKTIISHFIFHIVYSVFVYGSIKL